MDAAFVNEQINERTYKMTENIVVDRKKLEEAIIERFMGGVTIDYAKKKIEYHTNTIFPTVQDRLLGEVYIAALEGDYERIKKNLITHYENACRSLREDPELPFLSPEGMLLRWYGSLLIAKEKLISKKTPKTKDKDSLNKVTLSLEKIEFDRGEVEHRRCKHISRRRNFYNIELFEDIVIKHELMQYTNLPQGPVGATHFIENVLHLDVKDVIKE